MVLSSSSDIFANAGRKQEELKAVLAALSVQGTRGHTHLRDHIVAAYGNLLETRPELAPTIVGDLAEWKRWEYGGQVTAIADSATTGHDLQASLKLRAYVQAASAATNIELVDTLDDSNKANPFSAIGWLIATVSLVLLSVWFAGRGRNQ